MFLTLCNEIFTGARGTDGMLTVSVALVRNPSNARFINGFKGRLSFFGSRQLMVAEMNGRAGAEKKETTYDSGELLSTADAPYKRCVCQRNESIYAKKATHPSKS